MIKIKSNIVRVIFLLLLVTINVKGQELTWYKFELEDIKIDFPTKEVFLLDTVIDNQKISQLFAKIDNSQFILQKLRIENNTENKIRPSLPYNYESLTRFYNGVIDVVKEKSKAKNILKEEIKLGKLIGYKSFIYNNIEEPLIEFRIFLIQDNLITLSIYNPEKKSKKIKDKFFQSLNFKNLDSIKQYSMASKIYRLGYIFGNIFFYTALFAGLILLVVLIRKKLFRI